MSKLLTSSTPKNLLVSFALHILRISIDGSIAGRKITLKSQNGFSLLWKMVCSLSKLAKIYKTTSMLFNQLVICVLYIGWMIHTVIHDWGVWNNHLASIAQEEALREAEEAACWSSNNDITSPETYRRDYIISFSFLCIISTSASVSEYKEGRLIWRKSVRQG